MSGIGALVRWRKVRRLLSIYRKSGPTGLIHNVYNLCLGRKWDEIRWRRSSRRGGGRYLKVSVEFGTLLVDAQDRGISRELALYHVHEPIATEFMKGLLREGMVGIDIGANIGYYVLLEKRLVGSEGKVVAVEPAPRNLELLRQNIALNGLSGVTVVEGAVGDRDGVGTLYVSGGSNWHSMVPSRHCDCGAIQVATSTLDTLVHRLEMPRVDFVRMDVEGYEANILRGMRETLRRFHPALMIELHGHLLGLQGTARMLEELKALGYQTRDLVERELDHPWIRPPVRPYRKPFLIDDPHNAAVAEGCFLAALTASSGDGEEP